MRIMFVTGASRREVSDVEGLNAAARRIGHELMVLTLSSDVVSYCEQRGIPHIAHLYASDQYRGMSQERRWDLEEEFGVPSLRGLVWPETQYFKVPEQNLVASTLTLADRLADLLPGERPDLVLQRPGAEAHRRLVAAWAAKHAVQHRILGPCPLPGRTILHYDEGHRLDELPETWNRPLSEEARSEVDAAVDWLRSERPVYSYGSDRTTRTDLARMEYVREARELVSRGAWDSLRRRIRSKVHNLFRLWPQAWITRRWHEGQDLPDRYFFYPLHVRYDSQITVRNQEFWDQVDLVERLARNTPSGYKIVAKAHPGFTGGLSLTAVRRLRSNPNVHLADPRLHAHHVIEQASGVAIVASTVGFESLVLRTPILVLGNWTLNRLVPHRRLESWMDTAWALRALREDRVAVEEVDRILRGLYRASRPGSIYENDPDYDLILNSCLDSVADARVAERGIPVEHPGSSAAR